MSGLKRVKRHFVKLFQLDISNQNRISLFDVKGAYDAAYEEKAKARAALKKFNAKLKQAQKLDSLYRAQLEIDFANLYKRAV